MLMGYNTNGFAHHRLSDAAAVLARMGYRAIALTLDHTLLDPPDPRGIRAAVQQIRSALAGLNLIPTIETGARFILDPWHKHQPTLLSSRAENRRRRLDYLRASVQVAADAGAGVVSLWSGAPDEAADDETLFHRLTEGLRELLVVAESRGVRLAFEPEPGMFIDTMAKFERLSDAMNHPRLGLTLDVGHVHCLGDGNIGDHLRRWVDRLWNVHLEDMRCGIHEHLPFGEGEIDFDAVLAVLREVRYQGPVHVELSRHSHDAVNVAGQSYEFLCRRLALQSAT
jgi:L-ribulose-5-phosphate 3-epimerase